MNKDKCQGFHESEKYTNIDIYDSDDQTIIRFTRDNGPATVLVPVPKHVVGQLSEKLHDHINKGDRNDS